MSQLAPLLVLAAVAVLSLAYWTRWRRDDRLRPAFDAAAQKMGERAADELLKRATRGGSWWPLVLLALGGGIFTTEGRTLAASFAQGVAHVAQGATKAANRDARYTRPEWLDTRVIGGVPQIRRVHAMERDLRDRIVERLAGLPLHDVGVAAVFGDSVGIDYWLSESIWRSVRVRLDWVRFEEDAYLDERADAVAARIAEDVGR